MLSNKIILKLIKIKKGCRQGCPLSRWLFTLAIQPLLIAISQYPQISEITVRPTVHKISRFADVIILFLTNLKKLIPAVMEVIHEIGRVRL